MHCTYGPSRTGAAPVQISSERVVIMGLIIGLLVLWLVLVIVGFVVKALLWLAIVGIVLFLLTGVFGAVRGRARRRSL